MRSCLQYVRLREAALKATAAPSAGAPLQLPSLAVGPQVCVGASLGVSVPMGEEESLLGEEERGGTSAGSQLQGV